MDINGLVKKITGGERGGHGTFSSLLGMMGGQDQSGFSNLLSSLTNNGLGDQVKTWVGKGANQAVSGEQVADAVGPDKIDRLAESTGLSQSEVADHLAQQLPTVVDHLTPDGSVPDQSMFDDIARRVDAA
jgi:uncharacterized protein YidB (DUF937 family)